MKKIAIFAVAALLIVSFAVVAAAAPFGPGAGRGHGMGQGMGPGAIFQGADLTEAQKADWSAHMEKMQELRKAHHQQSLELKKEFLKQQVAKGSITQEQADSHIKMMTDRFEQRGFGKGQKHGRGPGMCPMRGAGSNQPPAVK